MGAVERIIRCGWNLFTLTIKIRMRNEKTSTFWPRVTYLSLVKRYSIMYVYQWRIKQQWKKMGMKHCKTHTSCPWTSQFTI